MSYTDLVPKPAPEDVNIGLSPLHQATMMGIIGPPNDNPTQDCGDVTNPTLATKLVTQQASDIFRVTGHQAAVSSLQAVLIAVKAAEPTLYAVIGTAGMLCARLARGSSTQWSNHSWGFAIDLTIDGQLNPRGSNQVQQGMLDLYPYFHAQGWYWGVGFTVCDSMHFECANETVAAWNSEGLIV